MKRLFEKELFGWGFNVVNLEEWEVFENEIEEKLNIIFKIFLFKDFNMNIFFFLDSCFEVGDVVF